MDVNGLEELFGCVRPSVDVKWDFWSGKSSLARRLIFCYLSLVVVNALCFLFCCSKVLCIIH